MPDPLQLDFNILLFERENAEDTVYQALKNFLDKCTPEAPAGAQFFLRQILHYPNPGRSYVRVLSPQDLREIIENVGASVVKRYGESAFGLVLTEFNFAHETARPEVVEMVIGLSLERFVRPGRDGLVYRRRGSDLSLARQHMPFPDRLRLDEAGWRTLAELTGFRNYEVRVGDLVIDQDGNSRRAESALGPEGFSSDHVSDALAYTRRWQGEIRMQRVTEPDPVPPSVQHIPVADVAHDGAGLAIELDPDGPGAPGGPRPLASPLDWLELDDPAPACPLLVAPDAP